MDTNEKAVCAAAKNLLDNNDYNTVVSALEENALLTLSHGTPDAASDNLRNLRAIQVLRSAVINLGKEAGNE